VIATIGGESDPPLQPPLDASYVVYKALASLAFLLLVGALVQHRNRKIHVPLALSGMALDLALVLILEFSRGVIVMTVEQHWSWAQWTHIGASSLAVLMYFPVLWYGIKILRGGAGKGARAAHKHSAHLAFALRAIGFGFMWFV